MRSNPFFSRVAATLIICVCTNCAVLAEYPSEVTKLERMPRPRTDVPALPDPGILFTIEGSINADTLVYAVKHTNYGEDVSVYWRRFSRGGTREPLTFLRDHFEYGVRTTARSGNVVEMRFNSYPDRPITIRQGSDGKFRAFVRMATRIGKLRLVYLTFDNSGLIPRLLTADVFARDAASGRILCERFLVAGH